jgi:hypothetical protein
MSILPPISYGDDFRRVKLKGAEIGWDNLNMPALDEGV